MQECVRRVCACACWVLGGKAGSRGGGNAPGGILGSDELCCTGSLSLTHIAVERSRGTRVGRAWVAG